MKTFFIVLTVTLLFCISHAYEPGVTVSNFEGGWDNNTKVTTGRPVTWTIRMDTPASGANMLRNGFRVFLSSDGTVNELLNPGPGFAPITYTGSYIDDYCYHPIALYGVDGIGADTLVFFVFCSFPYGFLMLNNDVLTITTQVENNAIGNYLCLDSSWYPPNGVWSWEIPNPIIIYPPWDGPHCYLIEPCCYGIRGDVTGDGIILVDDLIIIKDYLFHGDSAPDCLKAGDVVIDGEILVDDLVFLANYLFKGGDAPPPCE